MTEDNRAPRDPIYEFQRWLMRNGAKSVGRELKGTVSRTFGGGSRQNPGDVWETATTEPPNVGEAPECAWCPVCRAARRFRDSGPGIASHVAGAGDALLSVAQDTLSAFEASLSARAPSARTSPAGTGWPGGPDDHAEDGLPAPAVPTGPPTAPPAGPPTVTHSAPPPVPAATPPPAAHTVPPVAPHDEPLPAEPAAPPSAPPAGPPPAPHSGPSPATGATESGPAESGPSGAGAGPADDT